MKPIVELLSEAMSAYDLSPEQAAGYIGCSGSQVRRWISGRFKPTGPYVEAISRGLEKMKNEFDPHRACWTGRDIPAEEKKFDAEMKRVFTELESRLDPNEKYAIFGANPEYWQGFVEVLQLIRKYGVKLPK